MKKIKQLFFISLLCVCMILSGCTADTEQKQAQDTAFIVSFITIGKGDSFLMTSPAQKHYLMDTGKAEDYPQIARLLKEKDVQKLDGIFLSHGHKDHAGNLETILEAFPSESVYVSANDNVSYHEINPEKLAEQFGAELIKLYGGEELDLGGAVATVWIPDTVDEQNENNNSLILRVQHGEKVFLFMGDAEIGEEEKLLSDDFPVKCDVLKLGHHGEDDATSLALLEKSGASFALITGNKEENPDSINPIVSGLLEKHHVKSYDSDTAKLAIDFSSDGKEIHISEVKKKDLPCNLNLSFAKVDREGQSVTIKNNAQQQAEMAGCLLFSTRGDERYLFPKGTVVKGGQTITVSCLDSEKSGELVWQQEKVWKKKKDNARLYDQNLNLLAEDVGQQ